MLWKFRHAFKTKGHHFLSTLSTCKMAINKVQKITGNAKKVATKSVESPFNLAFFSDKFNNRCFTTQQHRFAVSSYKVTEKHFADRLKQVSSRIKCLLCYLLLNKHIFTVRLVTIIIGNIFFLPLWNEIIRYKIGINRKFQMVQLFCHLYKFDST